MANSAKILKNRQIKAGHQCFGLGKKPQTFSIFAKRHSQDDEEDDFERPQQNANQNQNEGAGDINLEDWKLEPGVIEYVKVYVVLFQIFIS